jgi:hypothetical protein
MSKSIRKNGKIFPLNVMKANFGRGGIPPFILNLSNRWNKNIGLSTSATC